MLKHKSLSQGIRFYNNSNIDAVTNIARAKAKNYYGEHNVLDVEAAMLSNHSTAVREYQEKLQKARENKKLYGSSKSNNDEPVGREKIIMVGVQLLWEIGKKKD